LEVVLYLSISSVKKMTIAQKYLYIDIDRPINLLKKKLDRSIQILQNDLYDFSFSFFFCLSLHE
jgi:hypothetical protein